MPNFATARLGLAIAAVCTATLTQTIAQAPKDAYVGSRACMGCHIEIYRKYVKTPMGRSMSLVTPGSISVDPGTQPRVPSDALKRSYEVFQEGAQFYQSESGYDGTAKIFENRQRLAFAIGSGVNGQTFAVQRGKYLFQAPLSYYSRLGKWDLSPGFQNDDQGFSRPIYDACITCHSGRSQAVPDRDGLYESPPFLELSIGCENCHGPGGLHIAGTSRGARKLPDGLIINPAKLPARVAEDICLKCHQGGDTRALLPGKNYSDFRPGGRLLETVAVVSLPPQDGGTDLLEHHLSMKLSKCFRASGGMLGCLTCHDPHDQPDPIRAPDYFRKRCLSCHSENSCRLDVQGRRRSTPPDNCIGCHMPRRAVQSISHSALTNHRITARPNETLPAIPKEMSSPHMPGLLIVNSYAGASPLPGVTKLRIYGDLLDRAPALSDHYFELLDQLGKSEADDPLVLAALGRKASREGDPRSLDYLSRAAKTAVPAKATILDLSETLARAGDTPGCITALKRGLELYPFSKEIRKHLVLRYIQSAQYIQAKEALAAYVENFPEDDFMRSQLRRAEKK